MMARYVIFARIYVGPPVGRWFEAPSVLLGTERMLLDDLMAGQIDGAIDRIEAYDIGDIARDVSEDIARALGEPVRRRIAEEGYRLTDELRGFIETHAGVGTVLPAVSFQAADRYETVGADT